MNDVTAQKLSMRNLVAGFVIALVVFGAAHAASSPVVAATDANDVVKLETLAVAAATDDERMLAKGTALSLRHKDVAAAAILEPLAKAAADKDIRAGALLAVSNVYLRQSRFADAGKAIETAKALRAAPLSNDDEQTMELAQALAGVEPMTVVHRAAGRLEVTRDIAGLARIPVSINGQAIAAVVDSGAGYSTLNETTAKRLGVELVERTVNVASASKDAVKTRLGVAKTLAFGDAVLSNVVFIVLPDSDLSFANGKYTIDAIMGLPVFEALGRIELAKENGKEALCYGAKPGARVAGNLILYGVEPLVLVDAGDAHLRLMIDTGATDTTLNASAARDYPALTATAVKAKARLEGAGGITEDADAMILPALRLTIAGRSFDVTKVRVESKVVEREHGAIGQDILKQGSGWVLDFETMSFSVSE